MKTANRITDSLSERCVREVLAIIEDSGVESLSLREVARQLGVSHQAPYKHFPDRDHLLAAAIIELGVSAGNPGGLRNGSQRFEG